VGKFLVAFDALLADADIRDSFIAQHMGHTNERSRGDSRLQDWPDAIWRMVREDDDPSSPRFFTAYGRDVDVHEGRLGFDPDTRRLTYAAGSRRDAKSETAAMSVIALLAAAVDGQLLSTRDIESALAGEHPQKAIRDGIHRAVKDGFVTVTEGRAAQSCTASPTRAASADSRSRHARRGTNHARLDRKDCSNDHPSASVRRSALPVRQHSQSVECVSASVRI
jgi:hypothetical protein